MVPLLLAALQTVSVSAQRPPPTDTLPPAADSAALATAYLDAGARELVRLARGHRGVIDASVFRYTATSRQRLSVGLRAPYRDRLLYRRESASLIDWRRDATSRVEVLGSREAIPMALGGVRVPDDVASWAKGFVPRPGDDQLFVNPGGDGFAWHPLADGAESLYTYASGDTTVIRLPDGRQVRLIELRVRPRERDVRVVTGSFWIETESHGIVRAVFRPSRDLDLERDDPMGAGSEVPGILKPVRFEVRYITVEHGLWEMRWWMPRLMMFDGSLRVGPASFPISVEFTYDDYTVEPDRHGLPDLPPAVIRLAGDPDGRPRRVTHLTAVSVPDTATLLHGPALPRSIFGATDRLVSEQELRELADRVALLPPPPLEVARPRVTPPWAPGRGLVRYNRVEGLSAGARVDWDLARVRLDLTGRLGLADLEPEVEAGVELPRLRGSWRLAGYRRLTAANPADRPLNLGNSASALLWGDDAGMYFRTMGAELGFEPAPGEANRRLRIYAERQVDAPVSTDASVRRLLDDEFRFRPNLRASRADQAGVAVRAGVHRGLDPTGYRGGAWLDLTAETGTHTFVRPGLTVTAGGPLPGALIWAAAAGAGTTLAAGADTAGSPPQSHWYLGGPVTVRGLRGGELSGRDHLRGRLEVASAFPAARVALFTDAGWAGDFDAYRHSDLAVSAGAGLGFLDGLFRLDLARLVRPEARWRLALYLDGLL